MRIQFQATASVALVAAAITLACSDRPEPTRARGSGDHVHIAAKRDAASPDLGPKLAALRQATAAYHDFAVARAAGYSVQVTGCREKSGAGGMGYHYAKGDLIDGRVLEGRPEVLLYEPQGKGRFRLVGVEFII